MKPVIPWLCRPAPIEGEILSSYLTRIAHANGLSPSRFTSFHFPEYPIWNRDIDRSASDEFIQGLAVHCNINIESIKAMTLHDAELLFNHRAPSLQKEGSSIAPWINSAGIYHRKRKRYAMQYCPFCLMSNLAYQRVWRLSFVTACEVHRLPLLDCCQYCGTQIAFHRNDSLHTNCHRCGRPLVQSRPHPGNEDELRARLQLQTTLLAALKGKKVLIAGQQVPPYELFWGLWVLLRAVRSKVRLSQRLGYQLLPIYAACPTERMELLRIDDRAHQCLVISEILREWPHQFLAFASSQHLTQTSIRDFGPYPAWLQPTISRLAPGMMRVRQKVVTPIRQKLRHIHRYKKGSWRTERAKILLKSAGIRK